MIFVLKIIKKNKINLSNDFLESLLVKWLPKGIPNDSGTIEKIAIRIIASQQNLGPIRILFEYQPLLQRNMR